MTNKRKQLKQIQNQAQEGRSMVEMLGVLAIIGVLSIGGIVGYRLAMNHYQASQIAHEMNMMRTDAQIKIAQGTENLTLGSPYDSGNIHFNNYGTTFACALANEEEVILNDVSCYAANAYYIELQEIPENVCQPLARLISGMDNLIDFYVNEPDAEGVGKDTCDEGNNTLTAIFGADSDSNAIKCDDVSECPENLPICFNHMCVECETNAQCSARGKDPYCDEETHRCDCPDGGTYQNEYNACVIDVETKFFITPNPSCTKITPRPFGPYKHSYEIWGHGTIDDFLLLYLNKEGPEDTSDVTKCNSGYDAIRNGCGGNYKTDFCPDFKLWDLKAGDYGNLVVSDPVTWGSWGISWVDETEGKPHRNDGKIWLILKDE